MNSNMKVKNISSCEVVIVLPDVRYRREMQPGQTVVIPENVIEDFNFDPGCNDLIREGYITVITDDEDLKTQLPVVEQKTSQDVDISTLLLKKSAVELEEVLKEASSALRDSIGQAAIKLSIADGARTELIKKYCGVDVLNALSLQRE